MTPRLRQVPRAEAPPAVIAMYDMLFGADRDPVAEPGHGPGKTPGNWWTVFATSPEVFSHAVAGLALYRSSVKVLDPQLRELGQIRAGYARGSQFVYSQHRKAMRDNGFTEEQIDAIPSWQTADCFTPIQRAVLAYTDCLVLEGGRVPDKVFDALKAELTDEQILLLTYITMTYELHATISRALRLEWDDRDDPIVEVGEKTGLGL